MALLNESKTKLSCFHCGDECTDEVYYAEDKPFCCFGCKTVYEILNENDLCNYYDLQSAPGKNRKEKAEAPKYDVLDRTDIRSRFVTFEDNQQFHATFYLPHIHCSSCIWLLENLHTLHDSIIHTRVDFRRKEIYIIADKGGIDLREIAGLLDSIGYEPYLSFNDLDIQEAPKTQRGRLISIAVAGFCFGNIMLFSAPEYLARGVMEDTTLQLLFQYLSLLFALPVFFYSANEFYISSWKSLKKGYLNIDAPIAAAIIITFVRSLYTVFFEGSGGYFDSMSGIVFFMLLGRYFQDRTYRMVSFNRDYKSYFPLSASLLKDGEETQVPISELDTGDEYIIRSNELVPADSILILGNASIDYSFVTGESSPVDKSIGELVYAGGRQRGSNLHLKVIKKVSQSYLTQLWNQSDKKEKENPRQSVIEMLSRYFSIIVFGLSFIAFVFWLFVDPTRALDALITPMIIACPCALLLSATFTNGNAIAWLGRVGVYLKNASVLERLTKVDSIVFDKTGTIAQSKKNDVRWNGSPLTDRQQSLIRSLSNQSSHPYSRTIAEAYKSAPLIKVSKYSETAGKGVQAIVDGSDVFIGKPDIEVMQKGSVVKIDNEPIGVFEFATSLYEGIDNLLPKLSKTYPLYLLSGDTDKEKEALSVYFKPEHQKYHCQPEDKQEFIRQRQTKGERVLMIGDGLNDAGALMQSDVGIAVTTDINSFTPASDVVMKAERIGDTDRLIRFAHYSRKVVIWSFIISIAYNVAGLFFALQGLLQPVIAAILMPLSTITIVLFTTGLTTIFARRTLRNR